MCRQFRAGFGFLLFLGGINQGLVCAGIALFGLYPEQVASRLLADEGRHIFRIAVELTVGDEAAYP